MSGSNLTFCAASSASNVTAALYILFNSAFCAFCPLPRHLTFPKERRFSYAGQLLSSKLLITTFITTFSGLITTFLPKSLPASSFAEKSPIVPESI